MRAVTRERLVTAAIFVAVAVASAGRGTGPFKWDASHYWAATKAIVGATPAVPDGYWELRGVFTAFIYSPAAALTRLVGDQWAAHAVLLQNSLVFAAAAALLLPAVVRIWRPVTILMRVVGAALFWAVTSGFAAYSLVDVYVGIAVLGIVILARSPRWRVLLLGGVLAGIAMNVRPAAIVVVIALILSILVVRRVAGLVFPAGVALALVPQTLVNLTQSGSWSPLPAGSDALVALQAGYASYVVRYDTMIGEASAKQFYCAPDMARLVGDSPPQTGGELALTFLEALPTSLVFSAQKIAASLSWHAITPYSADERPLDIAYAIGITAVAVVGIVVLFFVATRRVDGRRDGLTITLLAAIVLGTAVSIVSSATESRFALNLVFLGVVGLTAAVGIRPAELWRTGRWWIFAAAAATVVVLVVAAIGLGHPAPRGDVTASICAAT